MKTPLDVRLFAANKKQSRVLPRATRRNKGAPLSATWRITRTEGYSSAQLTLTGKPKDCRGLVNGRRVEFWSVGDDGQPVRLYRGKIKRVTGDRSSGASQTIVSLLGIWSDVSKIVMRQRYAWVDEPDVAVVFTKMGSSWVAPKYPDIRVEASLTGETIDSIDAWRRPFGDAVGDLIDKTGGFAVSGCDVSEFGDQDRIFLRGFGPNTEGTASHWLPFPDPSGRVTLYDPDSDATKISNVVDVVGGIHRLPNILAQAVEGNTSFEFPTANAASTGNLITEPGFEDKDASDIYGGASYKSGGLTEGPTDGGATMVELDAVGEGFHKEVTSQLVEGDQFTFGARLRLATGNSIGSKIRLRIRWYAGNTLVDTATIFYDDTNGLDTAIWDSFDLSDLCPEGQGVTRAVWDGELVTKVGEGILVDNVSAFDSSLIRQVGWNAKATGSAKVLFINWAYEGGKHGAYAVHLKCLASDEDGNDVAIQPANNAKFTVSGNASYNMGVWCRRPPGITESPLCRLFFRDDKGGQDSYAFTPGVTPPFATDGVWMFYPFHQTVSSNAENAFLGIDVRGDGEIIIDALQVRPAAVSFAEMVAEFLEGDQVQAIVRADDSSFSSDIQNSIPDWGEQTAIEDQQSLTTPDNLQEFAAAKIKASALPIDKPSIELVGWAIPLWPGEYIGGVGRDAPNVLPKPLPISEVEWTWSDGMLRCRPYLVTERESENRVTQRIAREAARKANNSSTATRSYFGGGSSGGSSGGGSGGSGSPTGAAGGDLSGTYPNPTVDGLQGIPVSATVPTDGQSLVYTGGSWGPATVSSGGGGVTDHGALTGLTDDDHPQYYNQTRGDARYAKVTDLNTEITNRQNGDTTNATAISNHAGRTDNPHSVTASQVGAYTTAQTDTLIGNEATTRGNADTTLQNNLNTHTGRTDNPHSVTKAQVGLSNVPNVDATNRANHTGTQTASTISDFNSAVYTRAVAILQQGSNVTLTPNSGTGTITIAASGSGNIATDPQPANTFFAGPASGTNAAPTFRTFVTDDLPNLSVTGAKLASGSVTSTKIGNGAVGTLQLADASITAAKIGAGEVTGIKLENSGVTAGTYTVGTFTITVDGKGRVTSIASGTTEGSTFSRGIDPNYTAVVFSGSGPASVTLPSPSGSAGTSFPNAIVGDGTVLRVIKSGGDTNTITVSTPNGIFADLSTSKSFSAAYGSMTLQHFGNGSSGSRWYVISTSDAVTTPKMLRQGFFGGMTPSTNGADSFEWIVPYNGDGTVTRYDLRNITWRVQAVGTAAVTIEMELYRGTGQFTAISSWGPQITMPANTYEVKQAIAASSGAYPVIRSGEKVRFRIVSAVTGGPSSWSVQINCRENTSGTLRTIDTITEPSPLT